MATGDLKINGVTPKGGSLKFVDNLKQVKDIQKIYQGSTLIWKTGIQPELVVWSEPCCIYEEGPQLVLGGAICCEVNTAPELLVDSAHCCATDPIPPTLVLGSAECCTE